MRNIYPTYELISDIGSGINFKRPGLRKIIDYAIKGEVETVVVAYKDRLCRMGYDMIEYIIEEHSSGKIIIENKTQSSPEEEVTRDMIQIINVFSARVNGMRKYKKEENIEEHDISV
jgi:predicted site-specific integrase-resolvase